MSKKIKLTQGKQAIVDDEDYKFLNNLNWYCGTVKSKVSSLELDYARLMIHQAEEGKNTSQKNSGGLVLAQLLIRGKQGYKITYKNGNALDNRKENLMLVPFFTLLHKGRKKNFYNGKPTSSKYKGVYWCKPDKCWIASITHNKKVYYLGRNKNEKEMAEKYNKKARDLYGECAYQNKIKD